MRRFLLLTLFFSVLFSTHLFAQSNTVFRLQDETQLVHLPIIDDEYFVDDKRSQAELVSLVEGGTKDAKVFIRLCYLLKKNGEHTKAGVYASKGVEAAPDDLVMLNLAGAILLHSHQYDLLNELCHRAIAKNNKNADAYNLLGIIAQERGYTGTAIYNFEKALSLEKKYNMIKFNLANSYRSAGRYDEAIELYRKSTKKFLADKNFVSSKNFHFRRPNMVWVNNNIGLTYAMKGEYNKSIEAYKEALHEKSNSARVFNGMACTYYELGLRDSCFALLSRAIECNHKYASPYKNLGNLHYEKGNFAKALEYFGKAYELDKSDKWLVFQIGCTHKNLREYDKALVYFDEALKIESNDAESYYEKGLCYYRLSMQEEANEAFNTALKLGCEKARGWIRK